MDQESLRATENQSQDPADLSLRALRVFVAVQEAGSMAVAAEQLGASASAVSQQISNLERSVGARLFDRAARPIALTPAGALLCSHAHRILEAVGEARSELMELNLSSLPALRLAIIDDLDATITPELVAHLHKLYPRCCFTASSGRSDDMTDSLLRREADVVVSGEPPQDISAFDLFPLLREPFVLVSARGAIDDRRDISEQLMALPFVSYPDSLPIGRTIARHLRRLRIVLPQRYAFEATRSVLAMVRNDGGWAITTPLGLLDSERFRADLEVRPLPFVGFNRSIQLIARRDELGRLPEKLAELCRDLILQRVRPSAVEIAPWAADQIVVHGREAPGATRAPAAVPAK